MMNTQALSRTRTWAGLVLVLATGLMHGVEGPAHYHEAAYQGLLFFLNAAGALVAVRGIYRGEKLWGWTLGVLISAGALTLYIVSHTIGLPGLEIDDEGFESLGVASLLVEGALRPGVCLGDDAAATPPTHAVRWWRAQRIVSGRYELDESPCGTEAACSS